MRRSLFFTLLMLVGLGGCAALPGNEPLRVTLAGVESMTGEGMELRLAVKLRVQNPNDAPVNFDGVSLTLEVRGYDFASGVSDTQGSVPRFGESVLMVPVTVSATAMLKQAYSLYTGDRSSVSFVARGKLSGNGFGAARFESSGIFDLPGGLTGASSPAQN
jgi:LEA14-like dessication related protein